VAFLCTCVKRPDVDDWKKLSQCMKHLCDAKELPPMLKMDNELNTH